MDPTSVPINPADLKALLQSGGNTAALVLVYVGFKIKDMVKKYIETQLAMMESVIQTNAKLQESQKEISSALDTIKTKLGLI